MSNRWPAGIIRRTPVTPTGPLQNGTASGVWTLAEASYWTKQGLWPTAGNFLAVEDVFSTWLYTGNASTQTITNGINLSGQGGLVWVKPRNATGSHLLRDTVRGGTKLINTDTTGAEQTTDAYPLGNGVQFNSNGFSLGPGGSQNGNGFTFASWTFREAPNFFDVVTWTGNGTNQFINHNLGVTPGFVIYKATSTTSDWFTLARGSNGNYSGLRLNLTNQADITGFSASGAGLTPTTFNPNAIYGNTDGVQYVAYLFAHDTSSTGFIQCGSYTGNGSNTGPIVTLGWEPQWVMIKNTSTSGTDWIMLDNMRGMPVGSVDARLTANTSDAESSAGDFLSPTATGFQLTTTSSAVNTNGSTYIYMAIRRGPMKTPTLGTSVFAPISRTGTGSSTFVSTSGFPSDNYFVKRTDGGGSSAPGFYFDRLRGGSSSGYGMSPTSTAAENSIYQVLGFDAPNNNGVRVGNVNGYYDASGSPYVDYHFRRAPSFFDTVCYTGTGVAGATFDHNLGVAPELMIVKRRNAVLNWVVYNNSLGNSNFLVLNLTNAVSGATYWNNTDPTSTQFTLGGSSATNLNGGTYVAYLFASAPGVSKVGSYTGTGALQTINCAFTTGARFVLIKRTDSTGDWYVWDSARGITSGNDPYTLLNTSAAQVTGTNYVDTTAVGFQVTAAAPAEINAVGGTYIFLAIA